MDAPDNDDAISLPSDAASLPSDALSLRSEVVDPSLPSDKDSEPSQDDALAPPQRHWRHSCNIACGCGAKVLQKPIQAQSASERFDLAFSAVLQHVQSKQRRYSIGAQIVCRPYFVKFHGICKETLQQYTKEAQAGHTTRPSHARKLPGYQTQKMTLLDGWFLQLYQELAEPLAIPDNIDPDLDDLELEEILPSHPLASIHINIDETHFARRRYLNPGTTYHHILIVISSHASIPCISFP